MFERRGTSPFTDSRFADSPWNVLGNFICVPGKTVERSSVTDASIPGNVMEYCTLFVEHS